MALRRKRAVRRGRQRRSQKWRKKIISCRGVPTWILRTKRRSFIEVPSMMEKPRECACERRNIQTLQDNKRARTLLDNTSFIAVPWCTTILAARAFEESKRKRGVASTCMPTPLCIAAIQDLISFSLRNAITSLVHRFVPDPATTAAFGESILMQY